MTRLRSFLFRLSALVRSRQMDREIDDEITSHLAEATEEYVQQGLSPEEARWAAQRSFGGVTQTKEVYREVRSFLWLQELPRDVRYALRTLRKSPTFTMTAAATLALAIGANTTMFSVLNAVLLRPLPYRAPEQLAMLWTEDPTQNLHEGRSALWDVEQWLTQSQSFADMATFDSVTTTLTAAEGTERIVGASTSHNLLSLLGVQPVRGRNFSSEETEAQKRLVLIVIASGKPVSEARAMRSAPPSCSMGSLPRSSASSPLISRSRGSMPTCGSRTQPAAACAAVKRGSSSEDFDRP